MPKKTDLPAESRIQWVQHCPNALPCPFCGDDEMWIAKRTDTKDPFFFMLCECDASGPSGNSMFEAFDGWNNRSMGDKNR